MCFSSSFLSFSLQCVTVSWLGVIAVSCLSFFAGVQSHLLIVTCRENEGHIDGAEVRLGTLKVFLVAWPVG